MAKEEAKKAAAKKPAAEAKGKAAKAEKAAPVAKAAAGSEAAPADYVPRLRKHYDEVVRPALLKQFGIPDRRHQAQFAEQTGNVRLTDCARYPHKRFPALGQIHRSAMIRPLLPLA